MKYDLARELADAGFPQGGEGKGILPPDQIVSRRGDRVYAPTLSELIAACGLPFEMFDKGERGWCARRHVKPEQFEAGQFESDSDTFGEGMTPEDAVARLWLALQRK